MKSGNFYFLSDAYYKDFPDKFLMRNKENINDVAHNRPCFFAFEDKSPGIYWLIPCSSQVDKFKKIYASKTEDGRRCDTIVFGKILGHENVFLIQNMCPVTEKYIMNMYYDSYDHPVNVPESLKKEIISKAHKVLTLQRKGYRLIFPDIISIENELIHQNSDDANNM